MVPADSRIQETQFPQPVKKARVEKSWLVYLNDKPKEASKVSRNSKGS